ncbi:MAG: M1 family peptidase, partial [Bacteroidetes bacterium]|nr:M1 family peptidase [Bacteroidota bacterium]
TWKYHAENVHDFAFTADPTYRIGEVEWNGIKAISMAQEMHAAKWQNAASYTADIVKVYSEDFGMYVYHKIIVADARDGMEYPMLTLDGGKDPGHRGLLAHEIGHNWFYGMVGNNEAYRAFLDEGFTSFIDEWALIAIDGDTLVEEPNDSRYIQKFSKPTLVNQSTLDGLMHDGIRNNLVQLNTHSDEFGGKIRFDGGYRQVYSKTATMLYNLQYVLGNELFLDGMKNYFNTWKIAHPYPIDFRNSMIRYTKVDLNWFFDQWLESTKTIDYGVKKVKKIEGNKYEITFNRIGRLHMPIDFEVIGKDGKSYKYYIPNTWFEKATDATILPRWIGWDNLKPTYTATVEIPGGIEDVIIDPSNRLFDVNMLNNTKKCPHTLSFDWQVYNNPDRKKYEHFIRPDLWYNGFDGMKFGAFMRGHYFNYKHIYDFNIWYNLGVLQQVDETVVSPNDYDKISFRFNYKTGMDKCSRNLSYSMGAKFLDGLNSYDIKLTKKNLNKTNAYSIQAKSMFRQTASDLQYLLYPNEWLSGKLNNTLNLGFEHKYYYKKGQGNIELDLKSSSLMSDYNYGSISLTSINRGTLGKLQFNTRVFAQYGGGSDVPYESSLFFAGGNPEEMMDNKFMRSNGIADNSWLGYGTGTNHLHFGGGLNLRGYSGYLIPDFNEDSVLQFAYRGNTGAAINLEVDFDKYIKVKFGKLAEYLHLDAYLFGDAGLISHVQDGTHFDFSNIRVDAGAGFLLTINKWGALEMVKPLSIRFDMPFFLNRAPAIDDNFVDFRWIVGIDRAF